MKKNRLHIVHYFFCSILILPLIFIIILQAWQFYLNLTVEERIEEGKIETVIVEEHRVVWQEAGREVTIDGEYFDLVTWKLEGGKYIFTGVYDEEETAVNNLLSQQKGFWHSIIRLLILGQSFAAIVYYLINFDWGRRLNKKYCDFQNRYKFLFNDILSPPPRQARFVM